MNINNIRMTTVGTNCADSVVLMMNQEIKGTKVFFHTISSGKEIELSSSDKYIIIIFQCSGTAVYHNNGQELSLTDLSVFIGNPAKDIHINAKKDTKLIELQFDLNRDELLAVTEDERFPYVLMYSDAKKYREKCKSEKTVSRILIPQRLIPRFAMGSVETGGNDIVSKHTHPMLEQYFFSLDENDCVVMIDDINVPFKGNTLLHIPLGSDHGILSSGQQKVHYIWMDVMFDDSGLEYMDSAHMTED